MRMDAVAQRSRPGPQRPPNVRRPRQVNFLSRPTTSPPDIGCQSSQCSRNVCLATSPHGVDTLSDHDQAPANADSPAVPLLRAFKAQVGDRPDPATISGEGWRSWLRSAIDAGEVQLSRATREPGWCSNDYHVWLNASGEYQYTLYRCGRKTCPDCAEIWSSRLRLELLKRLLTVPATEIRHIVLTVPNVPIGALSAGIDQLYKSRRDWIKEGVRGKRREGAWLHHEGYICKLEVTWSRRTGWHPHLHLLMHLPTGIDLRRHDHARLAWGTVTARHGPAAHPQCGLSVTALARASRYRTDDDTPDDARRVASGAVREIGKYCAKPLQLRGMPAAQWDEITTTTHGRRFVSSSGNLAVSLSRSGGGDLTYCGLIRAIHERHGPRLRPTDRVSNSYDPRFYHDVMTSLARHLHNTNQTPPRLLEPLINQRIKDLKHDRGHVQK